MDNLMHSPQGAQRLADALLKANGGRSVFLRLPSPAVPADDSEQLGLATPLYQDTPLEPVSFRKADSATIVLLVSATAIKAIAGILAFDSVDVLFANAVGLVIDGVLYRIESNATSQSMGEPYCYCLTLKRPEQ